MAGLRLWFSTPFTGSDTSVMVKSGEMIKGERDESVELELVGDAREETIQKRIGHRAPERTVTKSHCCRG